MFHRNRKPLPFADFPRSILVPNAENRKWIVNWADFIEIPQTPTPRHVERRTYSYRSESGLGLQSGSDT